MKLFGNSKRPSDKRRAPSTGAGSSAVPEGRRERTVPASAQNNIRRNDASLERSAGERRYPASGQPVPERRYTISEQPVPERRYTMSQQPAQERRSSPEQAPRRRSDASGELNGASSYAPRQTRQDKKTDGTSAAAEKQSREQNPCSPLKALLLLVLAVAAFAGMVIMSLQLMQKSSAQDLASLSSQTTALKYVVSGQQPAQIVEQPNLEAPVGVNHSAKLNILLIFPDADSLQTDGIMLASLDLAEGSGALLSFPRDTYITGHYEIPKLNRVYHAADGGERGAMALKEKVKEMIGYWPDYYMVLDAQVLEFLVEEAGGLVDYSLPAEPAYSLVPEGTPSIRSNNVSKLFQFRPDYTDVETEPALVQRQFVLQLFQDVLTHSGDLSAGAAKLAELADTDLSGEDLTYLAYFMKHMNLNSVYSRALPGGQIEVEDTYYYQVDIEAAVSMLNEQFNPTGEALTVYDVNFRQKTGDSGEGEFSEYGFAGGGTGSVVPTEPTQSTEEP